MNRHEPILNLPIILRIVKQFVCRGYESQAPEAIIIIIVVARCLGTENKLNNCFMVHWTRRRQSRPWTHDLKSSIFLFVICENIQGNQSGMDLYG